MKKIVIIFFASGIIAYALQEFPILGGPQTWSLSQINLLKSLSLSTLPDLPLDPSNKVAEDDNAAEFGHALFFDVRLSGNNNVACATCHQPDKMFTDGLTLAIGSTIGTRHTPSLVGLAHSPWLYWDGRKDSQWAQALSPLEASHEHNTNRFDVARLISNDEYYAEKYTSIFGSLPRILEKTNETAPLENTESKIAWKNLNQNHQIQVTTVFVNAGKALAAYQRKLLPGRSRIDDYIDQIAQTGTPTEEYLSSEEIAGLALFIGKAQCITCHNGPLLTNHEFHNTGVLTISGQLPSMGRYDGIRLARVDPFNCLGGFSDADDEECVELSFARDTNDLVGAQKTPTLRNIKETAPYMHGGQLKNLLEVMDHYNRAPVSLLSHNESKPLALRPFQLRQLEALMSSFSAPLGTEEKWLNPP